MLLPFLRRFFCKPQRALGLLLLGATVASNQARAQAWQRAVVASGQYRVNATAADSSGNVYIAGYVSQTATFGTITLTSPAATLGGNAFVAKWSKADGNFAWALLVSRLVPK